jgi:hypothetical protein
LFTYNWKAYEYFLFAYTVCFLCKLFTMRCFLFHLRFCRETHSRLLCSTYINTGHSSEKCRIRLCGNLDCCQQRFATYSVRRPLYGPLVLDGNSSPIRLPVGWLVHRHSVVFSGRRPYMAGTWGRWKGSGVGLRISTGQKLNFSG